MNKFTADYSSSINSAPAEDTPPRRNFNFSQTPQLASTTPLVPPPSTLFGSSQAGSGVSKLQLSKDPLSSSIPAPLSSQRHALSNVTNSKPTQFKSRPFHSSINPSEYEEDEAEQDDDDEYEDEDDDMEEDGTQNGWQPGYQSVNIDQRHAPSLMKFSTVSTQPPQSRSAPRRPLQRNKPSQLPRRGDANLIPRLARDLGLRSKPSPLDSNDTAIIGTEQLLQDLDDEIQQESNPESIQNTITQHALQLIGLWQRHVDGGINVNDATSIGPASSAPPFTKANYLASLLLALHHPPASDDAYIPIPQVILDWLDNYHVSYEPLYHAVASTSPNITANELFWDAVQSLTLRGKLQEVVRLLAEADFKHAISAQEEGEDEPGYRGAQLQTIQSVIYRARQALNTCPALRSANWDTSSSDWDIFRRSLELELDSLTDLAAEGGDGDVEEFHAENFGLRKTNISLLGRSSQKSSGSLPWAVYQGLKVMYNILMGSAEEIIAQSQDWLEASAALTIWWDGAEDAKITKWSFDVSRASNASEDIDTPTEPYLRRLHDSILCVTDPSDKNSFPINGLSPVEVGLASILQGHIDGLLIILQSFSQPIAAAVAEVGSVAGWLVQPTNSMPTGLDQSDLMVLNFGKQERSITKNDILLTYASALFDCDQLQATNGDIFEGWEVSLSVLTRINDARQMRETASALLDRLEVTNQERAGKIINLCSDIGLQDEAQKISERFGDYLVNNTTNFGTALLCYARGHNIHKVRQVIDLLVSYCLVQSKAYPSEDDLDPSLRGLVGNPKTAFNDIAEADPEAAGALQFFIAGYACLRKYYALRDNKAVPSYKAPVRPLARKRAAAKALVAVINSAADCIYGGLFDQERESAIQVDGLLSLLGEATALLANNDEQRTYTSEQMYALLAAIEDIETVSSRVYAAAEECFQASLQNYHGSQPPSPHAMLKKSMSSGTNSNFSFSMMGSEMLAKSSESVGGKSIGSTVLVSNNKAADRGWDWREHFKAENISGNDVLNYLRHGIAIELSVAVMEE